MSHLQDIVAIAIVLICAIYAARSLLPNALIMRITGNSITAKQSATCGSCDGCATDKNKTDRGCH